MNSNNEDVSKDTSRPRRKWKRIRNLLINILIAAFIAIFLNLFVIDTTKVTSGSMEGTILNGDFLFVEKLSYGAKTPARIPFTNLTFDSFRMPGLSSIERGDVVLFKNPLDSSVTNLNHRFNYVKRCIGLPGDTIEIKNRIIIVNHQTFISQGDVQFVGTPQVTNYKLFPKGNNWTMDNYGPIYIPQKNDIVKLNPKNIELYKAIINAECGTDTVSVKFGNVYLGNKIIVHYAFKKNYYFLLGDNRNLSADSRFWGFLDEDKILGRIFLVYMSVDPNPSDSNATFFKKIRWNRIAKLIR